jgi:hypothetical protein
MATSRARKKVLWEGSLAHASVVHDVHGFVEHRSGSKLAGDRNNKADPHLATRSLFATPALPSPTRLISSVQARTKC